MYTYELRNGWAIILREGLEYMRVRPQNAEWVCKRLGDGASADAMQSIYGV